MNPKNESSVFSTLAIFKFTLVYPIIFSLQGTIFPKNHIFIKIRSQTMIIAVQCSNVRLYSSLLAKATGHHISVSHY